MLVDFESTWRALAPEGAGEVAKAAPAVDEFEADLRDRLLPGGRWFEAPDLALPPGAAAWRVAACASADASQYDILREIVTPNAAPAGPAACLALQGAGCHGQDGRPWRAVAGNLHLSAVLPCRLDAAACGPALPMLPAVALCDALDRLAPGGLAVPAGIKWVNDILVADGDGGAAKLGGVLTAVRVEGGVIRHVFCGVGLNVGTAPRAPGLRSACLAGLLPAAIPLGAAAGAVLHALDRRLREAESTGTGPLATAYRDRSLVIGAEVVITGAPGEAGPVRGRVVAIGDDLALHLAGRAKPVTGGRLTFAPPAAAQPR